jgi:hypothetical protein
MNLLPRVGLAASLVVSAASHAYLYVHGSQHILTNGPDSCAFTTIG